MTFDHAKYQRERYNKTKSRAIQHLGGRCVSCGAEEELQFDHISPTSKSYALSTMFSKYAWDTILKELNKCQLLCVKCHETKTASELKGRPSWNKGSKKEHGSYYGVYTLKCRCLECSSYRASRLEKRRLGVSPRPPKSLKE